MDKQTTSADTDSAPVPRNMDADARRKWTPLPRSKTATGIVVRARSKVSHGFDILFDQAGLELCGLRAGQHVSVRLSPEGDKLSLTPGGPLKISADLTRQEILDGHIGKLIVPALRLEGDKDVVRGVWRDAGTAILNLPGKVVM